MNTLRALVVASLVHLCLAGPLYAQDLEDPAATGRFHLGALRFTPTFTFAGPGIDTNVFNQVDDPKRDTTARAGGQTDWSLHAGRGLFTANTSVSYQYFATYASERSWNTQDGARFALSLGRFTPFVSGTYLNARERPNYEIDARVRREEGNLSAGTAFRLLGKTTLIASLSRLIVKYDRNDGFYGIGLSEALDRNTDTAAFEVRHRLTPLTTFVLRANGDQDRFDYSHYKDADSIRVMPGFEFKPFALISGKLFVGYRSFRPLDHRVPAYSGVVASLDLAYVLSSTRFTGRVARDVVYSYEVTQPYYLLTDVTVGVTQMITRAIDVRALVGHQILSYTTITTSTLAARDDTAWHAGASAGYWVGRTLRIGFDVDYYQRYSPLYSNRDYQSWQAGVSVKYGLKP